MTKRYDLAIIGAGSAGLIAADFAVKLGARVALLERDRVGGDCTWTGCVPSKSLLKIAKVAHEMRTAARFGIGSQHPAIDMQRVRAYLHSAIHQIYAGTTPEALQRKGMDVLLGQVSFVNRHTLAVGESRIRAKKILIGTGAEPIIPAIPGLDSVPFLTYRQIFENDRLPQSMVVIGGGPVGLEVAQAYARLGTQVTVFARRLLPKEEPEVSEILLRVLRREGLTVIEERALSVQRAGDRIAVQSEGNQASCDLLFVAAGRAPALAGLNLEAAGVTCSADAVEVNQRLETSAKNIYAAGDVLGAEQFSHLAGWQGFQAARNALLPGSASGFPAALPRVTFCDPEVAQVGKTEAEVRASGARDFIVRARPIDRADRAVCDDDRDGIFKFIVTKSGTILGATIVGARAGDAITELSLAIERKLTISDLAGAVHPYPTYSSAVQLLASELAVQQSLRGMSGYLLRMASMFAR
jgi:pyruvate/2-oxoglutarate dehydrogenase complex dihydrolipoamide dehydrogenase (E3) component